MRQMLTPSKGMNFDLTARYVAEGEYKLALNCNSESYFGDSVGGLSSDVGNTLQALSKFDYKFIGAINTDTSTFVVFLTNGTTSDIALFDPLSGSLSTLISTDDLNFDLNYPVKGVFRLRNGCERVIYFTDTINPFRVINLDSLDNYKNDDGTWNAKTMELNRSFNPIKYANIGVEDSGGSHRVGAKQLSYRYLDEDGNSTNWSYPTVPTYITDEPINGAWNNINGAFDDEFYTTEQGGVGRTNKRMKIELEDVDISFSYLQFALLESLEGLGTVTNVYALQPIEIIESDFTVYINGGESQILEEIALSEVQIDREPINVVNSLEQTDNTLFLGGIKTRKEDVSQLQQAASKITVDYEVFPVNHQTQTAQGNPHNYDYISYPSDEVLAFGVVFAYSNGTYSSEYHIPGRNLDDTRTENNIISTWSENLLPWTTEDNFNDNYAKNETELAADPDKPVLRRWQVYNTSYATGDRIGKMAYHESSTKTYPAINNCEGESVWGVDSDGKKLEGNKIRHHRFPDRRSVGLVDSSNNLQLLGLNFGNISYPSDDIVGHIFVRAIITEENKTIADRGILFRGSKKEATPSFYTWEPRTDLSSYFNTFNGSATNEVFSYSSPKMLFDSELVRGSYLKYEGRYPKADTFLETENISTPGLFNGAIAFFTGVQQRAFKPVLRPTGSARHNIAIDESVLVKPDRLQNAYGNFDESLFNPSKSQVIGFIHPTEGSDFPVIDLEWTPLENVEHYDSGSPYFVSIKRIVDPYDNLFNLAYIPIHNNILTLTDNQSVRTGGSSVVSPMHLFSILNLDDSEFLSKGEVNSYYGSTFWVENEYNFSMRVPGTSKCNTVYIDGSGEPFFEYVIDKVAQNYDPAISTIEIDVDNICEEYYGYNKDLTKLSDEKIFVPVPYNFDYCDECQGEHPDRIYYSEKDNSESIADNYRVFRANNYTTLSGQNSRITDLLVDKDELYALTRNYNYYVPIREQRIQTTDTIAFLGSAERLSQPPKRLVSPKFSYGGSLDRMSVVSTPFGTAYASRLEGKVFLLSDALNDISARGMRSFFKQHLDFKLSNVFKNATGVDYPFTDSLSGENSVGLAMTYDPTFSRLILAKKDYEPKVTLVEDGFQTRRSISPGTLLASADGQFTLKEAPFKFRSISITDEEYFKPVHWTISYDLVRQAWRSFHSFTPNILFNNERAFYTSSDNGLYEHLDRLDINYYGIDYEAYIEFIGNDNPTEHKSFDSIKMLTDTTPSAYWTYSNEDLSTGKKTLVQLSSTDLSLLPGVGEQEVLQDSGKYNIVIGRDQSNDAPVISDDILYTPINVDFSKSQFQLKRIKGDTAYVRIYWDKPFTLDACMLDYTMSYGN